MNPKEQNKTPNDPYSAQQAADLARAKIQNFHQPDLQSSPSPYLASPATVPMSKHQQYMQQLSNSGKSVADIQTAWYQYYENLPDIEKNEVWQEFYVASRENKISNPQTPSTPAQQPSTSSTTSNSPGQAIQSQAEIIRKTTRKQKIQSIVFGLGMGGLVTVILLFGFFNERFIAPFITPSRAVSSTPIIADPLSTEAGPDPEIIIPKINVQIPVVYTVPFNSNAEKYEKAIQAGLEKGVVHYDTTQQPGENGNVVIVGHSSNNIFNKGKYKFAFVLLNKLENGDLFYLTKNRKRYVYRVYEKKIVKPSDVSVLGATSKVAAATLITCDPPGTSINRLVVNAEQISPSPELNSVSDEDTVNQPKVLPGNAPSLWSRITDLVL